MNPFTDQIAVITGASSGVGKAIALALGERGATLCLVGRELATLEAVATVARTKAPEVRCYRSDLVLDEDIKELAAHIRCDLEQIDILIHSAGFISRSPLGGASLEDFDRHYRVNVRAPYALTQALLPNLRLRQGQIVFINSSVAMVNGRSNLGQYAATKHALKAIADSLREEVNPEGIRVLSVFLGQTATPMQAALYKMERKPYRPEKLVQPEDVAAMVMHALSLPKTAELVEIYIRPMIRPE